MGDVATYMVVCRDRCSWLLLVDGLLLIYATAHRCARLWHFVEFAVAFSLMSRDVCAETMIKDL